MRARKSPSPIFSSFSLLFSYIFFLLDYCSFSWFSNKCSCITQFLFPYLTFSALHSQSVFITPFRVLIREVHVYRTNFSHLYIYFLSTHMFGAFLDFPHAPVIVRCYLLWRADDVDEGVFRSPSFPFSPFSFPWSSISSFPSLSLA